MHYLLYGHGGCYNHGAEAIIRCTVSLLRKLSPGCHITLATHFPEQDCEFNLPVDELIGRDVLGNQWSKVYESVIQSITPQTICIHVGGDNYCYKNWQRYAYIHEQALVCGARSILWSCSLDPEILDDEMMNTLRTHYAIFARESITYNLLERHGARNVYMMADVAFALIPVPVSLELDNYIAVNLSPLVIRKYPHVLEAFRKLLEDVLCGTDLNIALVPHVVMPVDNDMEALSQLCKKTKRVHLVSDKLLAAQYKSVIGGARLCIAARTHACIAAYSMGVPTLAVGYSTKAAGIAQDLGLGDYCLSAMETTDKKILEGFYKLQKNAQSIRSHLQAVMPAYLQLAAGEIKTELILSDG